MLHDFYAISLHQLQLLKGYSQLRLLWHIDRKYHKSPIDAGPTTGKCPYLFPFSHSEWRGGYTCASLSVHYKGSTAEHTYSALQGTTIEATCQFPVARAKMSMGG